MAKRLKQITDEISNIEKVADKLPVRDADCTMTAKRYLEQIRRLEIIIDHRLKELEALRVEAYGVRGLAYDTPNVQSSPAGDTLAKAVVRIEAMELEINELVDSMTNKRHRIIAEIHALDSNKYIQILFKRYVEFKSLDRIADEIGYDRTYMRQLHIEAIESFEATHNISGRPVSFM